MVVGEATQGQGPERGVASTRRDSAHVMVLWSFGCWRRRGFFWGVGESREAEQTHNRVWGVEKEDQERPLHFFFVGQDRSGKDGVGVGTRGRRR